MPRSSLPLVVRAGEGESWETLRARLAAERARLERQVARVGAILYRGFDVRTPRALAELVQAAGGTSMRYVGGDSPRTDVGDGVYTSTECPPAVRIPLHNECRT